MAEIGIGVRGVDADHVLDLLAHALGLGGRQVDLVEHRHDFEIGIDRLIDIGERLRFHALARIDHQQRALAGGQTARDFIGEVHMAGRVHQVEDVGLAVLRLVFEADGLRLDGDAALALDIHGIEHLVLHLARGEPAGDLDQPVGKRRFAMVDMGDDGKIADMGKVGHGRAPYIAVGDQATSSRVAPASAARRPQRQKGRELRPAPKRSPGQAAKNHRARPCADAAEKPSDAENSGEDAISARPGMSGTMRAMAADMTALVHAERNAPKQHTGERRPKASEETERRDGDADDRCRAS